MYLLRKGTSHYYATGPAGFVLKRFVQIAGSGVDHYLRALELWDQDHIRLQKPHSFEHLLTSNNTPCAIFSGFRCAVRCSTKLFDVPDPP